jgi:putative transposase
MPTNIRTKHNVSCQVVNAVACCVKVKIPDTLAHGLDDLLSRCSLAVERMLADRSKSSSKYYGDLVPCVVSKSLITKYQKNAKCKEVSNLVIPVCGDKGKQIKLAEGGVRIPAIFKKSVLPVQWPRKISGHVRSIELFRRKGEWFGSICYSTPKLETIETDGVIGVDRNSVGNIAVFADLETGAVRKLGICPARTKFVFRRRRKNLQRAGKTRLLKKLYRKQRRRMSYENHRATRAVVDYAATHRRAVVMERLENVRSEGSKIRGYSERNQWAFAQFGSMLRYKCALRGIPLIEVPAAYTSQECSRCGSIHKPNGKHYKCETCGHNDHRDANAAFVIGFRAYVCLLVGVAMALSVSWLRFIGNAQAENLEVPYADN